MTLDLSPAPGSAPMAQMVRSQAAFETKLMLRNGENLLLTVIIPTLLLVLFSAVDVVDTTGAGDVFHGAYALAIGTGLDVRAAMSFSAATAAMKCRHAGGRNGIPDINECLAFMRTKP